MKDEHEQQASQGDARHWRGGWLGLYVNRADPRLWVPKKRPGWGWTVNFGHPKAPLVMAGVGVAILAAALLPWVMESTRTK